MKVLVAGGAGFIGSHVCDELIVRGHRVVCLDNFVTGHRDNVDHLRAVDGFSVIDCDVSHAPQVDADLILHLASPASPVHYKEFPIETMLANSAGTYRLLDVAKAANARFVLASTSEVYGDPLEHPQKETYWGNVNPIGPRACYDESKRFGEALTFEYRRKLGVNASVVRIFNTYGPRMNIDDGRVVPAFISAALDEQPMPLHGDGTQTRSFCYVEDLVAGLLLVALDGEADGEVFNLGNPHEVTMRELAAVIGRLMGVGADNVERLPRGADDPERRRPDITKMRSRYGWEPRIDLEEGMRRTIEYFRAVRGAGRLSQPA
jgi:dTDP-glucose 4,6-dehydratase/UDP-glucuronate decarboxylase